MVRNAKAAMPSRMFSLGAEIRKGLLSDEICSAIDIVAACCHGLFVTVPAASKQMTVGPQTVLRLQAPGVM
jgi:hypothetical protein